MKSFYIDSATSTALLALFDGEKVLGCKTVPVGPLVKDDLFGVLEQLFQEQKLELSDLDWVGIGIGPGSFTGMRVASSLGASLAYALEIPLIALTSMDGYEGETVVFDAKRGRVYVKEGDKEPRLIPLEELQGDRFVTPHLEALKGNRGNWVEGKPSLEKIGRLLLGKFTKKQFTDPKNVQLIYLQSPV